MPCPRTQHLNNVPRLRGEKHDISLRILHQAGFETARQAATSAKRHALTIAPCPSLANITFVVVEIAFKVAVMTSSVAKITFAVAEIIFKVPVITSSMVKITFVVTEITF